MVEHQMPLKLVVNIDGDWYYTDRLAEWMIENMRFAPILDVKQVSKWYPEYKCHLSSIDAKIRFADADDALFFKVVWL